jgi:hypothetical protein
MGHIVGEAVEVAPGPESDVPFLSPMASDATSVCGAAKSWAVIAETVAEGVPAEPSGSPWCTRESVEHAGNPRPA